MLQTLSWRWPNCPAMDSDLYCLIGNALIVFILCFPSPLKADKQIQRHPLQKKNEISWAANYFCHLCRHSNTSCFFIMKLLLLIFQLYLASETGWTHYFAGALGFFNT